MERKELAVLEPENGNGSLSIPQQQKEQLKNASALAQDVAKIVKENGLSKSFKAGAKEHVFVEGWLTISRVNNEAPHAKVETVEQHGDYEVIKARAWITDAHGSVVSEADGYCSTEEKNWADKPFYARASMAQTRAIGKAMRLRHAWVMVMAGFSPTPAEEMDGVEDRPAPQPEKPKKEYKLKPVAQETVPTVVPDVQDADGELVTILKVATKNGEKNGKPWTRYGINVRFADGSTDWLNTFSSTLGEIAQGAEGGQLVAVIERSEFNGKPQLNVTDFREVSNG